MYLTGRFVALVAVGVVPTLLLPSMWTVVCWTLLCVAVAGVDIAAAGSTKILTFRRLPTAPIRLGDNTTTVLSVHNPSTRNFRGQIRDSWQPSAGARHNIHPVRIEGNQTQLLTSRLYPTRRGDRRAERVVLRRLGPLGVAGRQGSHFVPGWVRALPAFDARKLLPSRLAHLRQLDGRSAVRTRGQGTEFDSLRDYVEGDDVRSIDWRATARRRSMVVRTWQPEKDRHIVIVLDTSRMSAGRVGDTPRLDSAMDAALLLAALGSHAGDRVDLIAGDRVIHRRVLHSSRTALLAACVNAMTNLESALLEADWAMLGAEVARVARSNALVVLLTPLEPAAVEESLLTPLTVLAERYRVVIGSVADPALTEMVGARSDLREVYDAAAAARSIELRERTGTALRRMGVDIVDAPPQRLPAALADHYLLLKSRGVL